jgi:hypothetical protein
MLEEFDTMRITACKAEEDYKLWLRFEDGLEGRVFLGNLLEIGAFQLWRDVREFEKVSVDPETATVTWEGGIRLDALYPGASNPFPWMSEMIDLKKERNFFETRVIEYQTGGALSWE